jgi:hypothetical protein
MDIVDYQNTKDERILAKIIKQYEGYIYKYALRVLPNDMKSMHLEDMVQECKLWIIKGVNNFDIVKHGTKNSAQDYIKTYIMAGIKTYTAKHMHKISFSTRYYDLSIKYKMQKNNKLKCKMPSKITSGYKDLLENEPYREYLNDGCAKEPIDFNYHDDPQNLSIRCLNEALLSLSRDDRQLFLRYYRNPFIDKLAKSEKKTYSAMNDKIQQLLNKVNLKYKNIMENSPESQIERV